MIKKILLNIFFLQSLLCYAQERPNIILILADDMGFSDVGCYGGEIETPILDALAKNGIRYKQFYNAARCCPTRASLLTGLHPHQAGMGWMAAADLGTPAYQGNLNNESVTIAEVLKESGYKTYMTGKWHLSSDRKTDGQVKDNWPTQRGFDRFFGIVPGAANYFTPFVYSNNERYKAPNDPNYYLTDAISDTSVRYMEEHLAKDNQQPFFMYVAYNAPHWPLHAPKEAIIKYKEFYKQGWDKLRKVRFEKQQNMGLFPAHTILSPRDNQVDAWESLSDKAKEEMADRMAIYAAQVDIMDQGIGRIVQSLRDNNQLENTIILFLSDNGACAEYISSGKSKATDGTADTYESYRIAWANLSSTPFREYKHFTHEGGIATPLIVYWPKGINPALKNSFAAGYGQLTDIMATCIEVADAKYPMTYKENIIKPLEGKSLVPHFTGHDNNKGKMYWEHEANIALRDGKWKIVTKTPEDSTFDSKKIELFDVDDDPTEQVNLALKYPSKVEQMYSDWLIWANRVEVFPLDTREYNVRMQAYRRQINGSFDDYLGGWNIRISDQVKANITIDKSNKISGQHAAKIEMLIPSTKPNSAAMYWPLKLNKSERLQLKLKAVANKQSSFFVRLENVNDPNQKLIDRQVNVGKGIITLSDLALQVPSDGNYRIALYFGTMQSGDVIWIDDVDLEFL